MSLSCTACGRSLRPDARFCDACGARQPTGEPPEDRSDLEFAAERRHVTAVFCDLVGSTELGARLDAEDLHRVVGGFQGVAGRVVEAFGGHVENRMGDGLLALFGYPLALEDAAERAVRAGLAVVAEIEAGNDVLDSKYGVRLAIRVGVHSGSVIVSSRATGDPEGQALGHAMNVAARLQEIGRPGAVVLTEDTSRIAGSVIATRELGEVELRGLATTVSVREVVGLEGAVASVGHTADHSHPFVGRQSELARLRASWQRVLSGEGQVVFLEGDAGFGKSRLVDQFSREIQGDRHTWFECRCSPYTASSAYLPILDVTRQLYGFGEEEDEEEGIRRLEADLERKRLPLREAVPLLTSWLSVSCPRRYPTLDLAPEAARRRTLRLLLESFRPAPMEPPEVWVVEDLQWADASTLELIEQFLGEFRRARVLLLLTSRPQFVRPWKHGNGWPEVVLGRMERSEARRMVDAVAGGVSLPATVVDRIVERADGVPMFLEELTRAAIHAGGEAFSVPERLQDSLLARLDRLGRGRRIAQVCAVLGRDFSRSLVEQVVSDGTNAASSLQRLVDAEILSARGDGGDTTYAFRQSLLQECAYGSLLREQRQELNRRAARALRRLYPDRCSEHPELLARHHRDAGDPDQAAEVMARAAHRALETSAYVEAADHAAAGLVDLHASAGAQDRRRLELELQLSLGLARNALYGFASPKVTEAYARARALCEDLGAGDDLVEILYALWCAAAARGDHTETAALAERVSSRARESASLRSRLLGVSAEGTTAVYVGDFARASELFDVLFHEADRSGFRFEAMVFGADPIVAAYTYQAWADWLRGFPDRAVERIDAGLRLARELGQPFTMGWALSWAATVYGFRGEPQAARSAARELCEIAERHALGLWQAMGRFHRGNASARLGDREGGLSDMRAGLEAYRRAGARLFVPTLQALLAEVLLADGQRTEAAAIVEEAIAVTASTIEAHSDAELYRLRGEIRACERRADAEPMGLADALSLARRQGALSIELRIVTTLSRWHLERGAREEARSLLESMLGRFSEGADTGDHRAARALLAGTAR